MSRHARWGRFAAGRLFSLLLVLLFLLIATFMIIRLLPGDPAVAIAGSGASNDEIEAIRTELGLDRPLPEQFAQYVGKLLQGDLGRSYATNQPISELIANRIGTSVELAVSALAVILIVSVPLGMLAAHASREGRHRRFEVSWAAITAVLGAIPSFMMATLLIFIFAVTLQVLPVAGRGGPESLVLPVAAVVIGPALVLARIVRLQTLDALNQDYIRTARSKRLPWRTIYLRHVMPNVVTVVLTVGGILLAALISGAIFVEQIFVRPGMGSALVGAVINHDYPVVQASVLLFGVIVVVANTAVDFLVAAIDPRAMTAEA